MYGLPALVFIAMAGDPIYDADWQTYLISLSANWSGFSDPESGIASYRWAIGTSPGASDVLPFTSVGAATSAIQFGLALAEGPTYYVSVEAANGAGLTTTATSNGIRIDVTPPAAPAPVAPGASGGPPEERGEEIADIAEVLPLRGSGGTSLGAGRRREVHPALPVRAEGVVLGPLVGIGILGERR